MVPRCIKMYVRIVSNDAIFVLYTGIVVQGSNAVTITMAHLLWVQTTEELWILLLQQIH